MNASHEPATGSVHSRLLDDALGASTGAAVGAGLTAVASLALPFFFAIVPFGVVVGGLSGLLIKEFGQKRRAKEEASSAAK